MVNQEASLPALLRLPGELRNRIYEYIANDTKAIRVVARGKIYLVPLPISAVNHQLRQEFEGIYLATPLDLVTHITVLNTDCCVRELFFGLSDIPGPAPDVKREVVFKICITNALHEPNLAAFIKELAEPAVPPKTAATIKYEVTFGADTVDLDLRRLTFARMAKRYRYHCPESEQRVWEKIYWAFAEAAGRIDGISVKQFALGCWRGEAGRWCFV